MRELTFENDCTNTFCEMISHAASEAGLRRLGGSCPRKWRDRQVMRQCIPRKIMRSRFCVICLDQVRSPDGEPSFVQAGESHVPRRAYPITRRPSSRFRAKRERPHRFCGLFLKCQGQNLDLTVLYVPHSPYINRAKRLRLQDQSPAKDENGIWRCGLGGVKGPEFEV